MGTAEQTVAAVTVAQAGPLAGGLSEDMPDEGPAEVAEELATAEPKWWCAGS